MLDPYKFLYIHSIVFLKFISTVFYSRLGFLKLWLTEFVYEN